MKKLLNNLWLFIFTKEGPVNSRVRYFKEGTTSYFFLNKKDKTYLVYDFYKRSEPINIKVLSNLWLNI